MTRPVNFKWFSQNFDSNVSTLSAQTDVLPLLWLRFAPSTVGRCGVSSSITWEFCGPREQIVEFCFSVGCVSVNGCERSRSTTRLT